MNYQISNFSAILEKMPIFLHFNWTKKLLRCSAPFQIRLMVTYVDTREELWLPGSWVLVIPLLLIAVFTSSGIIFIIFTSSLTQGHVLQCMSDMGAPCWQHTGLCARALTCETSVTRECQHQGCHDMNHWKERQQYLSFTDSDETVELLDSGCECYVRWHEWPGMMEEYLWNVMYAKRHGVGHSDCIRHCYWHGNEAGPHIITIVRDILLELTSTHEHCCKRVVWRCKTYFWGHLKGEEIDQMIVSELRWKCYQVTKLRPPSDQSSIHHTCC